MVNLWVPCAGPTFHIPQLVSGSPVCEPEGYRSVCFPAVLTADFTWSAAHTAHLLQHWALLGSLRDVEPLSRLHLPEGLPRGIWDSAGFSH